MSPKRGFWTDDELWTRAGSLGSDSVSETKTISLLFTKEEGVVLTFPPGSLRRLTPSPHFPGTPPSELGSPGRSLEWYTRLISGQTTFLHKWGDCEGLWILYLLVLEGKLRDPEDQRSL